MSEPGISVAETAQPTVESAQQIRLVCMGASACKRVCKYAYTGNEPIPSEGLPLEQACSALDRLLDHELTTKGGLDLPAARSELISVTKLPAVEGLTTEEVADELDVTIEELQYEQVAFVEYLQTILCGAPRFAIAAKKQTFVEAAPIRPDQGTDEENTLRSLLRAQARGFYDLHSLKTDGILYDRNARIIMEQMAKNIALGHHIELSGEPGIAKTTIAKHIARLNAAAHKPAGYQPEDIEPVVLSFSSTSEAEAHVTEQTFEAGTLGQELGLIADAMNTGRGVVLDEYNGLTADQQIFFNDLLLKKPGQQVRIAGQNVMIANGFCVIATLNPMTDTQGQRRHGRQQQDSAGAARFERIDLHYPGSEAYSGNPKETLHRLFMSAWVDHYGWQLADQAQLKLATQVAEYVSELAHKATTPQQDGTSVIGRSNTMPLIAECITPRDLNRILDACFAHESPEVVDTVLRAALAEKTRHIMSSNNGHLLSAQAKDAVLEIARRHGMIAA